MIKLLQHTRRPDVTFCRNGRISITAAVARTLSLRPGDSVNIATHDDELLLFAVRHDAPRSARHIAMCHPTKRGSHNYCANSVRLARLMLDSCGITSSRASFFCGEAVTLDNQTYIPIIYKHPLL